MKNNIIAYISISSSFIGKAKNISKNSKLLRAFLRKGSRHARRTEHQN